MYILIENNNNRFFFYSMYLFIIVDISKSYDEIISYLTNPKSQNIKHFNRVYVFQQLSIKKSQVLSIIFYYEIILFDHARAF